MGQISIPLVSCARKRRFITCIFALVFLSLCGSVYALSNPNRLGAQYDRTRDNITFNVYANAAQRVELNLYASATGTQEVKALAMTQGKDGIWSLTAPVADLKKYGLVGTIFYGYRAWGPNWPYRSAWVKGSSAGFLTDVDSGGNRFNPNKLLTDPYSKELSHDPLTPTMGNGTAYASGPLYRNIDTGSFAPKSIVLEPSTGTTGAGPSKLPR